MALFKIFKGLSNNLPSTHNEGYCYFTTDDGKFYIDYDAVGNRKAVNAVKADELTTSAGNSNQPIYFSSGKPVICSYSLNKTVPADAVFVDTKNTVGATNKTNSILYIVGTTAQGSNPQSYTNSNIYINSDNVLMGAGWMNDYAEYRQAESIEPGRVVQESKDGIMKVTQDRLLPACEIISDTFGFAIGQTQLCQTPIAAAGRVLAYPNEDRDTYDLGDAVGSGPNGTVSKMTREEIMTYPERIIGYVSEIPQYEEWGTNKIKVNNRIWIRIR